MGHETISLMATEFTVSLLPETHNDYLSFVIQVSYRGKNKWAVLREGRCLSRDGSWDPEPSTSNREDDWLDKHRFTLDQALQLAREWVRKVTVGGLTVMDVLEKEKEEGEVT